MAIIGSKITFDSDLAGQPSAERIGMNLTGISSPYWNDRLLLQNYNRFSFTWFKKDGVNYRIAEPVKKNEASQPQFADTFKGDLTLTSNIS